MLHVRQLVADHPFELAVVEVPQDAFRGRHGRMRGIAAGRERVRRRLRDDIDTRHRQARPLRQACDDSVEPMVGPHFLRAVHAEDHLVREPVRHEVGQRRQEEAEDEALSAAKRLAQKHQKRAHRAEEQRRFHRIRHESILIPQSGPQ